MRRWIHWRRRAWLGCPCRVCPRCREVRDPNEHPEDGLAWCWRCKFEWWASVGPFHDGRCPRDLAELTRWEAHDNETLRLGEEPEYRP